MWLIMSVQPQQINAAPVRRVLLVCTVPSTCHVYKLRTAVTAKPPTLSPLAWESYTHNDKPPSTNMIRMHSMQVPKARVAIQAPLICKDMKHGRSEIYTLTNAERVWYTDVALWLSKLHWQSDSLIILVTKQCAGNSAIIHHPYLVNGTSGTPREVIFY